MPKMSLKVFRDFIIVPPIGQTVKPMLKKTTKSLLERHIILLKKWNN